MTTSESRSVVLEDGRTVVIRGLLRTDAHGIRGMLSRSSPETLYRRFLSPLPEVPEHLLALLADPDRPGGATLVALAGEEIVGHAMYAREDGKDDREAEVVLVVEDAWQANGIGKRLLAEIAIEARRQGVEVLACVALGENRRVLGLVRAVLSEVECEIQDGGCFMRASPWRLRPGVLGEEAKTQRRWDRLNNLSPFTTSKGGKPVTEERDAGAPRMDRERGPQTRKNVRVERNGAVAVITLDRPEVRNAIDRPTAAQLAAAVRQFEADDSAKVAVLYGGGGNFCSGLDLKALASEPERAVRYDAEGDAPTGIARMTQLSKPLIGAVEGYAVAAGLELAIMCDLRVASEESVFGMFNRRWGVPLTDGGTFRLPRLVGQGRAMDMILTGRPVGGPEALEIGLANRLVTPGEALDKALGLAEQIARFPQLGLRADRHAVLEQWSLGEEAALRSEWEHARAAFQHADMGIGAARFASGLGRHGDFGRI